jgi:hypothetical protein
MDGGVHEDMGKGNPHGWGVDWDMGIGYFPTDKDSWGVMRTWGIGGEGGVPMGRELMGTHWNMGNLVGN